MELTIIRDKSGKLIGAAHGHVPKQPPTRPTTGNHAGPMEALGHSFEHVTVPDDFAEIMHNPNAFGERLKKHLAR
jgi:hypothetical protein